MIQDSLRIWADKAPYPGQIVRFQKKFTAASGEITLQLCCDTDYIAFINGSRVAYGQFPNYPARRYYDTVDVTPFCRAGENTLTVTVRYEGLDTSCHIDIGAGLSFCLIQNGEVLAQSDDSVLAGEDGDYVQGITRRITGQLGAAVDMQAEGETRLAPCAAAPITFELCPRPVKKLQELPFKAAVPVAGKPRIFDLGREEAGYLNLTLLCEKDETVTLSYGEHLCDGEVRRKIGDRDFSLNFYCKAGENHFENRFIRLGGRYLQVSGSCEIREIGLVPVLYPLTEKPRFLNGTDGRIYDTCVRTLRLCMHEHYEDCPWREQALYVLDSRNQMKCGYVAFEETDFQKQMLLFMRNGQNPDGMLDLTFPTRMTCAIPSFSVMYPVSVYEYAEATGDTSLIPDVLPTIRKIIALFEGHIDDTGLIANPGNGRWNFYEWIPENCDRPEGEHDLILNTMFILALRCYKKLCDRAGEPCTVNDGDLAAAVIRHLFDGETGLFRNALEGEPAYTRLGNAVAVLCGLGDERTARAVKLCEGLSDATLSMQGFIYDAVLQAFPDEGEFVLNDIRKNYGYMLEQGATSFWETIVGQSDFGNAGSLCHGWSALPIYYYDKLLRKGAKTK